MQTFKFPGLPLLCIMLCMITAKTFSQAGLPDPIMPSNTTRAWAFICKSYAFSGILYAQVGSEAKGGSLLLSVESTHPQHYIGGTVFIFLEDNSIIVCTDKKIRSASGDRIFAKYLLTDAEMQRLAKYSITDIRFAIAGKVSRFSSQIGHFKAINRRTFFDVYNKPENNRFETDKDIRDLLNQQK